MIAKLRIVRSYSAGFAALRINTRGGWQVGDGLLSVSVVFSSVNFFRPFRGHFDRGHQAVVSLEIHELLGLDNRERFRRW